jgi:hypothetical protein
MEEEEAREKGKKPEFFARLLLSAFSAFSLFVASPSALLLLSMQDVCVCV